MTEKKTTDPTPGPWQSTRIAAYEQHDRLAVASVAPGHAELILVLHTFDGSQAEANVQLMAAAPDLLDALERFVHMASECNAVPGPNTLAQARAAIKKARGQS